VGAIGLVQNRNGSPESRHLKVTVVSLTAANTNKSLNLQEGALFLQVPIAATRP